MVTRNSGLFCAFSNTLDFNRLVKLSKSNSYKNFQIINIVFKNNISRFHKKIFEFKIYKNCYNNLVKLDNFQTP